MFHCNNNKTMCQKKPAQEPGTSWKEFVIDDLSVSQGTLCSWPLFVSYHSLRLQCLEAELLWWTQIYGDALLIAPMGQTSSGGRLQSVSQCLAQFILHQALDSTSLHRKEKDQICKVMNLWMINKLIDLILNLFV